MTYLQRRKRAMNQKAMGLRMRSRNLISRMIFSSDRRLKINEITGPSMPISFCARTNSPSAIYALITVLQLLSLWVQVLSGSVSANWVRLVHQLHTSHRAAVPRTSSDLYPVSWQGWVRRLVWPQQIKYIVSLPEIQICLKNSHFVVTRGVGDRRATTTENKKEKEKKKTSRWSIDCPPTLDYFPT